MNGFTYDSLEAPPPVQERLDWLAGEAYQPQPHEQLAAVYRRQGHDEAARDVLLAKQRRRRSGPRALWLAALLLVGTVVFTAHQPLAFQAGRGSLLQRLPLHPGPAPPDHQGPRGAQQWLAAALITAGWILATTILQASLAHSPANNATGSGHLDAGPG
ncbi:hypothetical protein [Nonomuraea rhodomycinica]|uniref:Uncharacterized protein n=1 Tax=Nonomuraea rhodomycinica TaxID=1712872 RepID=A0A7Y6IZR9_9ACTN|nr:hypothetical protein [Nonomuraea rhodomycinica]NUW46029.1 hypothetical protein [Nonomuraea rhodomycinica]